MKRTLIAMRGVVLACVLPCLMACGSSGTKPAPSTTVLTRTQVVEAASRQYIPLPVDLTAPMILPPLPAGSIESCPHRCLSNEQLDQALTDALLVIQGGNDRLTKLRAVERRAVTAGKTE